MPDFSSYIHPTRNEGLLFPLPDQSNRTVWFRCELGHEWSAVYASFITAARKCPFCSGRKVLAGFNDLATLYPELAAELHPTLNETLEATELLPTRTSPIWWVCPQGHAWDCSPKERSAKGKNCSYCSGTSKKVLSGVNDLATKNPDVTAEWHPTRNSPLTPSEVTAGTHRSVWWQCTKGHEWETSVANRARRKQPSGCPICVGQKPEPGVTDLATIRPDLAERLHPEMNSGQDMTQVAVNSKKVVWWQEPDCGHTYPKKVFSRAKAKGCMVCSNRVVLPGVNDLATTYPEVVAEWHPTKNSTLDPTTLPPGKNLHVWWQCTKGHEWRAMILGRHLTGCPTCSNHKVLKGYNDLATTHPHLAQEWHPSKNSHLPEQITAGSSTMTTWQCNQGHEWDAPPYSRTSPITATNCPVCSGKKLLSGHNDLGTKNPLLAAEWHPTRNNPLTPADVTAFSSQNVWWKCAKGHEWQATAGNRSAGKGCRKCHSSTRSSKAEVELYQLFQTFNITCHQHDRNLLSGQEVDFYFPGQQVAVEYNGIYWHSETQGKDRHYHRNKWLACKQQGVQLIQIWEDDWNRNPEQVKRMLAHKLGVPYGDEPKVMARKTHTVAITKQEAEQFLNTHHVQGHANGTYYLALVPKHVPTALYQQDDLLAVLVLKNEAGTAGCTLNIARYATAAVIPGGFTKLLTHAERTYRPEKFITFSDHCISDGGLYVNNKFIEESELRPDYQYVVGKQRVHKFNYRLKRFREDPKLLWQEGLSESQLAQLNNLDRVWDAGKTRWVKHVKDESGQQQKNLATTRPA